MKDSNPFQDIKALGLIAMRVVPGRLPAIRDHAQLSLILRLMTECWSLSRKKKPSSTRYASKLRWMPSTVSLEPMALGRKPVSPSFYSTWARIGTCRTTLTASDSRLRAPLLLEIGDLYHYSSKYEEAHTSYNQALDLFAKVGDGFGRADAVLGLAESSRAMSRHYEALELYTQGKSLYGEVEDNPNVASCLWGPGHVYRLRSRSDDAEESFRSALALYAQNNDDLGEANAY